MFGKSENKEMSEDQIFEIIDQWADILEVRLKEEDFDAVKEEIFLAVKKERLTFDESDEIFKYVLKKPVSDKDGNIVIDMIIVHESDMQAKRKMSKKRKDEIDGLADMFKVYCKKSDGEEIEHGFITRIKDRDQQIISAVILGFFVQAVPGKQD